MATSDRFKRSVKRFAHETFWLHTHHTVLKALTNVEAVGLDVFQVAHVALQGDRLIRLIRVLEEDARVASFWYLHRCEQKRVESVLSETDATIADLGYLSCRLRPIRDRVFVHIDKDEVFTADGVYKSANITATELDKAISALWVVAQQLFLEEHGKDLKYDQFDVADLKRLAELRDIDARGKIN